MLRPRRAVAALLAAALPLASAEPALAQFRSAVPAARVTRALALPTGAPVVSPLSRGAAPALSAPTLSPAGTIVDGTLPDPSAPKRVPVSPDLSAEVVEKLTPDQKAAAKTVRSLIASSLFTWSKVEIKLPGTIFDGRADKPLVDVGALYQAPRADELERLARKYRKLSPAQHAELKGTGSFSVPSEDFPGQTHEWRASYLLQKGAKETRESRNEDYASAAAQALVHLPAAIKSDRAVSMKSGVRSFFQGLADTASLIVGLPERQAKNGEGEIQLARRAALQTHMASALPDANRSVYDVKLMAEAAPILAKVEAEARERWRTKDGPEYAKNLPITDPQERADAIARTEANYVDTAYRNSAELTALDAGLAAALVLRSRFLRHAKEDEAQALKKALAAALAEDARVAKANPILSRIPSWRAGKVGAARAKVLAAERAKLVERRAGLAATYGLGAEYAAELAFSRGWSAQEAKLSAETRPARGFDFAFRIWRSANWTLTKDERNGYWYGSQSRARNTSTGFWFWRLANIVVRYAQGVNNIFHGLLVDNLWNGPLGLRALVGAAPFSYKWVVDQKEGRWVKDGSRNTLRSRLNGFWSQRRAILDAHEKKSSYAFFIGKTGERVGLFFYADLGLGLLAPLVVGVLQPVATIVNVIASATLVAATPAILAPLYSVGAWALNALVFDTEGTRYDGRLGGWKGIAGVAGALTTAAILYAAQSYFGFSLLTAPQLALLVAIFTGSGPLFPWVETLVKRTGLYGAAAFVGSVLLAVLHAFAAPAIAIAGGLRYAARSVYDAVLRVPLRRLASVPSESGMFIRRTAGPGLSSEYFFQVSHDVALAAAWAALEAQELARYDAVTKELIAQPEQAYERLAAVIGAFTGGNNQGRHDSPAFKAIYESGKANREALAKAVDQRSALYDRLLKVPHQGRVKLPAADLELALKKTAVLSQDFYGKLKKERGWSPDEKAAFWESRELKPGDWVGFAKHVLGGVFGREILVPLEETDKTLRIKIDPPGLGDYVDGLEGGILPGTLDKVQVDLGRKDEQPIVTPRVEQVSAGELPGGLVDTRRGF